MKPIKNSTLTLTATAIGLLVLTANVQAAEQSNRFGVGLYADNERSIYDGHNGGDDVKIEGIISFQYRGDKLNIDEKSASYKFFDNGKYQIEVIGNSEERGYQASDSTKLTGMAERKNSWDLGGRVAAKTGLGVVSLAATGDVSGKHKGQEVDLKFSQDLFRKGPRGNPRGVSVDLQAGVKWQSDEVVDYYYGVKNSESTAARATYAGKDAVTPYIGLTARTNIANHVTFDVGAIYKHYPDEITESPIADKDHDVEITAGLTYWF